MYFTRLIDNVKSEKSIKNLFEWFVKKFANYDFLETNEIVLV